MGRPNKGLGHVEGLEGAQAEKDRLRAILATITGAMSVDEACERLGIERARFQQLREQALQGALDALQPGKPGRPTRTREHDDAERLQREKEDLEEELEALRVRMQLALALPEWPRRQGLQKKSQGRRGSGGR